MTAALAKQRTASVADAAARVAGLDWAGIRRDLDAFGCATAGALLSPEECEQLVGSYASDTLFRSRVVMARHGFGKGEYKYFAYPLPDLVAELRTALYPPLAEIANAWNESLEARRALSRGSRGVSEALP